jgi:hypothetical protein
MVQVKHIRVCVLGAVRFKSAVYIPDLETRVLGPLTYSMEQSPS